MKKTTFKLIAACGILISSLPASADAAVIYIDFTNAATGSAAGGADTFNRLNSGAGGSVALNDSTGASTGATITITTAPDSGNGTGTIPVTGDALAVGISDAAGQTNHFKGTGSTLYTISGLDLTTNYTVTAYGSRSINSDRTTQYTVDNGVANQSLSLLTSTVAAGGNSSEIVVFDPITASVTNTLQFSFERLDAASQFSYLNAIRIDTALIPEPSAALLLGCAGLFALRRRRA